LVLGLAACGLDAPQQYLVPDLRILAVRDWVATTAFADADEGEQVSLEALVANPRQRSGVNVDWYFCPPWSGGPPPSCLDPQRLARPDTLPEQPDVFAIPGAAMSPGGSPVSLVSLVTITVPTTLVGPAFDALIAAARLEPSLRCRLFVEVPVVAIVSAEGITEVALKRVRLSPSTRVSSDPDLVGIYVLNMNPAVGTIWMNPADVETCSTGVALTTPLPAGEVTFCATASAESVQTFNQCQLDGSLAGVEETLEFQWYVSAGEIAGASFDGNATGGHVKVTPVSGPFTLWGILRDGRGGTDWVVLPLAGP
jgi:hypothetical protein